VPAVAGDWSASAGWGFRLDDHRTLAAAPGQDAARFAPWTQAITPAFGLAAQPLGARFDAAATGRVEVGSPVPGEGVGALRRGTAAEARAALERAFAAGLRLRARGWVARSRDLLDVDHATVSADADAARWAASARGESRRLEGEWHVRGWRSGEADPTDARSLGWGARAFLVRPAAGAVFVGGHERRMDRDGLLLLRAAIAALGLRRDLAPGLAATLEMGAVDERIGSDVTLPPRAAVALELASPLDGATQVRLRLARELGTEFELELSRSSGRARTWVRASSTVDIEGSGSATPAVIQRAAIGPATRSPPPPCSTSRRAWRATARTAACRSSASRPHASAPGSSGACSRGSAAAPVGTCSCGTGTAPGRRRRSGARGSSSRYGRTRDELGDANGPRRRGWRRSGRQR
jgi:hypothetical protein